MRILRLSNSNDFTKEVDEGDRGHHLVASALSAVAGEPVETIVKGIWPTDRLPALVEGWIDEYQPDIVFLKTNNFWFSYESVPMRLRRRFGRPGRVAGDAGIRAADTGWIAHNRVFRKLRSLAQVTIGGDTHFTIDEVLVTMEATMRRVMRHEDVLLVVRGSRGGSERPDLPKKVEARRHARRKEFTGRLTVLCDELDVPLMTGKTMRKFNRGTRARDMFHSNAQGHRESGVFEAEALVRVWRDLHPGAKAEDPAP